MQPGDQSIGHKKAQKIKGSMEPCLAPIGAREMFAASCLICASLWPIDWGFPSRPPPVRRFLSEIRLHSSDSRAILPYDSGSARNSQRLVASRSPHERSSNE